MNRFPEWEKECAEFNALALDLGKQARGVSMLIGGTFIPISEIINKEPKT